MGTGWRRAFCATIKKDPDTSKVSESPSPSGGSNPTTPRLHSNSNSNSNSNNHLSSTLTLRCRTTTTTTTTTSEIRHCKSGNSTPKSTKSPRSLLGSSNSSSPRSPRKLSLFRNSFKFRSNCGKCLNGVKTKKGTAIYTAECGHVFHFPCISSHVKKQGALVCPVCNSTWKDLPLLSAHHYLNKNDAAASEDKPVVLLMEESSPKSIKTSNPNAVAPKLRPYEDDEPLLLSPTMGAGGFNPIPEADEDLDVEEFQGFFVTPAAPKSDDVRYFENPRNVQVRVMPDSAVISSSRGYETYAVSLTVRAPPPLYTKTASYRAPIDLVTVLDVSGSMTGSKLHMLKRAMRLVISSLGSSDRLSIVAFSSYAKRLLPLTRMTSRGQRAAKRIVDWLVCGQGTSVGEALRKATKVLEDRRERNPVASIMLLSDGHGERIQNNNNNNNQRPNSSHVSSTRFAHIEIPVHAFGFGQSNRFTHQPGEDAFAKCVGAILSVVVQDLRIQLGFPSGSASAEILAVYSCNNGRPVCLGSGSVRLGDLYAEEKRELLVEMRRPVGRWSHSHHVMSVRCLYKDPASQEVVYGPDQNVLVPQAHGLRLSSEPKIERLRSLFISTRAIAEARRLVERNDFTSAVRLLVSSRDLLVKWGGGGGVSEAFVKGLEAELAEVNWWRQHYEKQQIMGMMMIQRRKGGGGERDHQMVLTDENGEPLTPTSAWRAAEMLAKVAMMKKSLNRVNDLHGFENARF